MKDLIFLSVPVFLLNLCAANDIKEYRVKGFMPVLGCAFYMVSGVIFFKAESALARLADAALFAALVFVLTVFLEGIFGKRLFGGGDIRLIFMAWLYADASVSLRALFLSCLSALFLHAVYARRTLPFAAALACGWNMIFLWHLCVRFFA